MPHQQSLDDLFAALEEEDLLDATLALDAPQATPRDDDDLAGGFRPKLALAPRP
ncbi:MAG: hypothetical protein HC822_21175, partial [Oscillochloris sp.]|nr:hypothetical protein [Oscillochloris sp.]